MRVLDVVGPAKALRVGGSFLSGALLLAGAGCGSRFVVASIENTTEKKLEMVEVDYPGASFGVSALAPRGTYSYRFKAIGSGALVLSYSELGTAHSATGPVIKDGQGGSVHVVIGEHGDVKWGFVTSGR